MVLLMLIAFLHHDWGQFPGMCGSNTKCNDSGGTYWIDVGIVDDLQESMMIVEPDLKRRSDQKTKG